MKLRVELDWRTTLATFLLVPGLVSLGFWQLDRAEEKAGLIARLEERRESPAITLQSVSRLPVNDLADRQVTMDAVFTPGQYVLLDNRVRSGRFGYEVVALAAVGELTVALNLGWIEGDPSRLRLPEVDLPRGRHVINGRIYQPTSDAFMLGENLFPPTLPGVVQQLSLSAWDDGLRSRFVRPVFPLEVRIGEYEPIALVADWAVVNQTPAKHQGYAVQWFTMAAALALAFVFRSTNILAWARYRLGKS